MSDGLSALAIFVRWELALLLGGAFVLIAYQLLTGRIGLRGLLADKSIPHGGLSVSRVQALAITLGGAMHLLLQVLAQPPEARHFIDVPPELLALIGGSQTLYLAAKAQSRMRLS